MNNWAPYSSSSQWSSTLGCRIKWLGWIFCCYMFHYFCFLHSIGMKRYFSHKLQCSNFFNIMPQRLTKFTEWGVINVLILIEHSAILCYISPSLTYLIPLCTILWKQSQRSYSSISFHLHTFVLMVSFNPTFGTPYFLPFSLPFANSWNYNFNASNYDYSRDTLELLSTTEGVVSKLIVISNDFDCDATFTM